MATGADVLNMLIPNGGWVITGDDWDGVIFHDAKPITKKEFTEGFAKFDAWKESQASTKAIARAALLERLGITTEEAALLLG
jgi:hypothetical protein